ncbi:MAG: CHAT domain-containing protein, partial [Chloroflexi bacterium]|nr:CHAT domain-containing protein [Chloroflexota bacterium]
YQQALEVLTRAARPVEWATTMMNLATAYAARVRGERAENLEAAIGAYQQALEVRTRAARPVKWAQTMSNLAGAYAARIRGERAENVEAAIAAYQQALEVLTRAALPVEWAHAMNNLATAYSDRIRGERVENLEAAIGAYQQALEVRTRAALPEDHRLTQRNLGGLCFAEGRWAQAAAAYQGALAAGDLLYRAAATPEARQAQLREVRDLPARLACALVKATSAASDPQEAVLALERNRARWLSEALALRSDRPAGVPEAAWQTLVTHREAIQALQAEARLPEGTPAKRDFLALSEALHGAFAALDEAIVEVRRYHPDFLPEADLAQIQAAADPASPLTYLSVTPAGALALLLLPENSGSPEPVWGTLTEDDLKGLLVQGEGSAPSGYLPGQFGQASLPTALDEVLPVLGERLMGPLADRLRELGARGVTLIPTGLLGLLPLHAARYRRQGQAVCLLDEFDVAYAPSARVLGAAREALAVRSGVAPVLAGVGNPLENPKPLPYARPELEGVAALFDRGVQGALYERAATEERLMAALVGATHVHLACHGMFNPAEPLDSHLQLANDEQWTLREILESGSLAQARLVVLSACQTGITDFQNLPDEVLGLPAGFLQAQVPGVVGTLWSVNDLSTMLLILRFYQYHLQGNEATGEGPMAPARALRGAQLWLRGVTAEELAARFESELAKPDTERAISYEQAEQAWQRFAFDYEETDQPYAHPVYWAPFMVSGT